MKLDDYSFELHQERVDKSTPSASVTLPFTYPHILTLLTSNSLLSMMIASLASVIQLSFTYPHVSDEAQMNNHQASHLVSIRLIFVFMCINFIFSDFTWKKNWSKKWCGRGGGFLYGSVLRIFA